MKQHGQFLLFLFLFFCLLRPLTAQDEYRIGLVGFYNFENLFDTLDAPDIRDEEFTPAGPKNYDTELYTDKLGKLAGVVAELGKDLTPDGLAVLGVAEIENRSVLEDFVRHPEVADRQYQIIHFDSPDRRGIDVALLYQAKYFQPLHSSAHPLLLYNDQGERIYTRDVLLVSGTFDGEPMHFLINHWPSRSGGEAASQPRRNAAAQLNKQIADSIRAESPEAKLVIMGDLNDDPISPSVAKVLRASGKATAISRKEFFNPMYEYYRKGLGTLAYRDSWSLFDQILLSKPFVDRTNPGYQFYRAFIHNPRYLLQKTGRFKGYPYRAFVGDTYLGGYSDHFPVYLALIKQL